MSGTFADESTRVRARLVVLISGGGSNLQALIDATSDPDFPAQIVGVGADRADATGLDRAMRAGVPTFVVDPKQYSDRGEWDRALAAAIAHATSAALAAAVAATIVAAATATGARAGTVATTTPTGTASATPA